MRERPARSRPRTGRAPRSLVRCGGPGLAGCLPFDRGVHLHAIEHPSDNRAARVAQQEDAVRGERPGSSRSGRRGLAGSGCGDFEAAPARSNEPSGQEIGTFVQVISTRPRLGAASGVNRRQCRVNRSRAGVECHEYVAAARELRAVAAPTEHPTSNPRVNRSRGSIAVVSARLRCSYRPSSTPHGSRAARCSWSRASSAIRTHDEALVVAGEVSEGSAAGAGPRLRVPRTTARSGCGDGRECSARRRIASSVSLSRRRSLHGASFGCARSAPPDRVLPQHRAGAVGSRAAARPVASWSGCASRRHGATTSVRRASPSMQTRRSTSVCSCLSTCPSRMLTRLRPAQVPARRALP